MSRFVFIGSNGDFQQRLGFAIAHGISGDLQTVPKTLLSQEPQQIIERLSLDRPEVLIFGPDVPTEDVLRVATVFDIQFPEVSLILIARGSPDLILQAMRAGIRDVLDPESDVATIRMLLERACQAFASRNRTQGSPGGSPQQHGLVVGVFSPKGGVGKTTIATNLAVGLGKIAPMGVVLVDMDLQFGDVASSLHLTPDYTVTDAVTGSASQDSMVLKAYLSSHPAGIYALSAPKSPVDADEISGEQISRLLQQLAAEFAYVIVDTGPGMTEHSLAVLEGCSEAVWVTGMDVPSVRGMRIGLDTLRPLNLIPDTTHVVLNFADSKTGLSVQDIEATLGAPVDVSVPRSRAISISTNRGVPILQEDGRDPAVKGLGTLVRRFDPKWRVKSQKKLHRRVVV